jgi:hypothetical protein
MSSPFCRHPPILTSQELLATLRGLNERRVTICACLWQFKPDFICCCNKHKHFVLLLTVTFIVLIHASSVVSFDDDEHWANQATPPALFSATATGAPPCLHATGFYVRHPL